MAAVHNPNQVDEGRLRPKREREEQPLIWLDALLTEHDVARITGLSVASVRRWRLFRRGPRYLKIGAAVRYKPEDISAWLASRPSGLAGRGSINGRLCRSESSGETDHHPQWQDPVRYLFANALSHAARWNRGCVYRPELNSIQEQPNWVCLNRTVETRTELKFSNDGAKGNGLPEAAKSS
jgi:predicted DNA-binding transcriptional regulator AlpA